MEPITIQGMKGLGDNIYQRPFIRHLSQSHDLYLVTPWPELYQDLPVKPVYQDTPLRTQKKNLQRQRRWHKPQGRVIRNSYAAYLGSNSIVGGMAKCLGNPDPFIFDLPDFGPSPVKGKVAVIRPVTERREWKSASRNPKPEYIYQAAQTLMDAGYTVVSIADIDGANEWIVGDEPPAHVKYHKGELPVEQLLALVQNAAVTVGGVGWLTPASIAAGVKSLCILGGRGAHNSPPTITDPRMDLSNIYFATPDNYCMCAKPGHSCNKTISDFPEILESFLS